jgi:hypothetical protein
LIQIFGSGQFDGLGELTFHDREGRALPISFGLKWKAILRRCSPPKCNPARHETGGAAGM